MQSRNNNSSKNKNLKFLKKIQNNDGEIYQRLFQINNNRSVDTLQNSP